MASVLTRKRPPGGWREALSTNPGAYGSTRDVYGNAQVPTRVTSSGQTVYQPGTTGAGTSVGTGSGGGSSRSSQSNTALNNENAAKNASAMAEYNRKMAEPHGLEQGYSINQNINWKDKGTDGKAMENMETFDEQLSQLKGVLTLAKQWIAPKRPSLLSTDNRIDPGNEHGGGAVHGDRQDSQSDRNSSNYSGAGPSNPTNQSSGIGKSGKKNKGGRSGGRASDPGSGGSASN